MRIALLALCGSAITNEVINATTMLTSTAFQQLKLSMAPKKTRMGSVNKGFHFLGIQFTVARTTAHSSNNEQPQSSVEVTLHPRSIRRSIDKLRLKQEEMRLLERKHISSADHPAYVQRHCYRWANWWQRQHAHLCCARTQVGRWREIMRELCHSSRPLRLRVYHHS